MSKKAKTDSDESEVKVDQNAVQVLEAAMALGATLNALVGMVFYEVAILQYHENAYSLGFYPTEKDAYQALAEWVVSQWDEMSSMGSEPWANTDYDNYDYTDEELRAIFIKNRTHKELVEEYFENDDDSFEIARCVILKPEPVI